MTVTFAGDDVDKKKPDPKIYNVAAQRLGVDPADCVVVEDSTIGLKAALGAGMRCIITYTPSTKQQVSSHGDDRQTIVSVLAQVQH
jgi:beta-phosphoglucomutase-like phosphatase (HAD superfamily)